MSVNRLPVINSSVVTLHQRFSVLEQERERRDRNKAWCSPSFSRASSTESIYDRCSSSVSEESDKVSTYSEESDYSTNADSTSTTLNDEFLDLEDSFRQNRVWNRILSDYNNRDDTETDADSNFSYYSPIKIAISSLETMQTHNTENVEHMESDAYHGYHSPNEIPISCAAEIVQEEMVKVSEMDEHWCKKCIYCMHCYWGMDSF